MEGQVLVQAAANPPSSADLWSDQRLLQLLTAAGKFLQVWFKNKGFNDLGFGLQTSQIKQQDITSVADVNASICGGECRKLRGSEHEGENSWSQ